MANKTVRYVNVIPTTKLQKKKPIEDVAEDTVACRVCNKGFARNIALVNHVRMEHIDVFATGDPDNWTQEPLDKKPEIPEESVKTKTEELLSSMEPTSLMSLASPNVSYIIIKSEDVPITVRKRKEKDRVEKVEKLVEKKPKEPQPITGPFECVHPSTSVADGICHQIFFSCCEYSAHVRDEHSRRRRVARCQVCEKLLGGRGEQGEGSEHACLVCGLSFPTSEELSAHATTHTKVKPFSCSVCRRRFTALGGMQQHMRSHTGHRPYPCTFCPKAFTQKSGLDQHLRIHTKVKPYRCVVCTKTFCQSVHLKQHMRTHTNVSPFQCAICQKRFKQSSHLNYHLKYHNPTDMTEEQRTQYAELMGLIDKDSGEGGSGENGEGGSGENGEVESGEVGESVILEDAETEETYILGDLETQEHWHVQLVERNC